ncbi:DUF2284 domain-containing protein [Clostridium formicaceticum]|uniref:Release factor glutamine methyltransferase n=1 Tax=Clostridium formicaceticum TaxID=1497 RepID=A0AAC9RII0_9CLOT|nr:DUF2284 domain-containing protein [Clostridium formicaceticum]AOY77160.1 hypothetical protein BJL90_15675 [Clostridium formicaceticum]ARE87679.1 Release factor glutamine methyltransferase [Clostridium formicaceticum]
MLNSFYDPQKSGVQYLEDLACGYWHSQVIFTAIELELFNYIGTEQKTLTEISQHYTSNENAMERFLDTLVVLGLLVRYEAYYYNSQLASAYLIKDKALYQGDSILWRKALYANWQDLKETLICGKRLHYIPNEDEEILKQRTKKYIKAMDCIAKSKAKEITKFFEGVHLGGTLLDVGAGSGAFSLAFLEDFSTLKATLFDLSSVIAITKENLADTQPNISYHQGNILEDWQLQTEKFHIILLSNILHAYSEKEVEHILNQAAKWIDPKGFIIIHDFFLEHYSLKARLSDLNMMVNTYNGKVFEGDWVCKLLKKLGFYDEGLLPLESDTALIIASKSQELLKKVHRDQKQYLMLKLKKLGFRNLQLLSTEDVAFTEVAAVKCQFGCQHYGLGKCPPNSLPIEKTKKLLKEFKYALLLEGEPPTKGFQKKILKAEKEAYQQGFYKAFSLWAGPCSLCSQCEPKSSCPQARPSMEGCGIDVFQTVKNLTGNLETVKNKNDYVKYFGLLLLE